MKKLFKYKSTASILLIIILTQAIAFSSPYKLSPVMDGILIGSGTALYGFSIYSDKYADPLTDSQIAELSENDINILDRPAAHHRSASSAQWSDAAVTSIMISPAAFLAAEKTRNDLLTIGVMYGESILITTGLCGSIKNIVHRKRPYTYNSDVPDEEKKKKDSVRSFYSGHTANAFNSAVFISTVYSEYYPENSWRFCIWGASLSAASLTGYLRYRAGKHYPTDIIAGAVTGSTTGWLIPALHRQGNENISFQITAGDETMIAVIMTF
ncbi:MAG: phosphoesterase PA-phosphatase [Spirochaetae bacterium HGW-Spirochaetae-5]|nr:MAG: phosphoesterase PA-phosphatase [Spirochaetae bacterium HGW-Spirochaetae-5]